MTSTLGPRRGTRLRSAPPPALGLAAIFPTTAAAGAAVRGISAAGLIPSRLELLDHAHFMAIGAYRPMGLRTDAKALLLAAVDTGSQAEPDLARIAQACTQAGADEVYPASDAEQSAALLQARRFAYPAMERYARTAFGYRDGAMIINDVAVPCAHLADMLDGIERIATEHGVPVAMVGHAGDGNLPPNIIVDRGDPSSVERGKRVFDAILDLALSLGGTVTGEHGVGLLKQEWLGREIGPVGLRLHQAIKAALDPNNLPNPGKVP